MPLCHYSETMVHILQTIKGKKGKWDARSSLHLDVSWRNDLLIKHVYLRNGKLGGELTLWLLENSEAHPRRACCLATPLTAARRRCSSCVSCLWRTCSCFRVAHTRVLTTKRKSYSKEKGGHLRGRKIWSSCRNTLHLHALA